ncbi:hypothetical protein AAFF_G00216060 [Aldrovandia affinis]|uniref:Ig-like domain-containing protein n=1 Tax=Aldrovandia affinis TaxID=143900 RepID=A0AAD7RGI7_9TELE|nr:hypothetical protein AAFF_G00216060 [Aldrovandia affinis]
MLFVVLLLAALHTAAQGPVLPPLGLRQPPSVDLGKDQYVRLVGEGLNITCTTRNPNFSYNVTWRHSAGKELTPVEEVTWLPSTGISTSSVLTMLALNVSDTGNITCTGTNEAGANSSTTHLQVVDQPYIRMSPVLSPTPPGNKTTVEVTEGKDLELRVRIEAYPEIREQWWDTPASAKASREFLGHNNRYEAALHLKRMQSGEQGKYVFNAWSSKANASITFHVHMFRKCGENGTWLLEPLPAQGVQVQLREYGPAEVTSALTLPPPGNRTTVECVAVNSVGLNRDTFVTDVSHAWLLTPILIATASLLLLLTIVLLYKYNHIRALSLELQLECRLGITAFASAGQDPETSTANGLRTNKRTSFFNPEVVESLFEVISQAFK